MILSVENLHYSYPSGDMALNGVNLNVAANEKVGLVGCNGAGKSTLLLSLNGLIETSGSITVCGLKLNGKESTHNIRKSVGLLFQNPDDQLFSPTLYDDIAFGPRNMKLPKDEVEKRVADSLNAVGLSEKISAISYHLSYGQKKRAALATILAMEPKLLLLDEPTSGLDPKSRGEFIELIGSLKTSAILATHDFDLVEKVCSRVVIIHNGIDVANGSPQEIFSNTSMLQEFDLT